MAGQARFIVDVLLPAEGDFPGGAAAGADRFLEEFQKEAPLSMRLAAKAALFFAGWASPLLIARLPPLSRLSRDDAERALAAMGRSRWAVLRQLLLLLKATVSFHYGADENVRRAIGFPS